MLATQIPNYINAVLGVDISQVQTLAIFHNIDLRPKDHVQLFENTFLERCRVEFTVLSRLDSGHFVLVDRPLGEPKRVAAENITQKIMEYCL